MRVVVRIKEKLKTLLIIVITAVYFGFAFPVDYAFAASEQNVEMQETDQLQDEETDTTTIEEEPTAEAATIEQNHLMYQAQIIIIGLGIIMAAAGTYVFVLKKAK